MACLERGAEIDRLARKIMPPSPELDRFLSLGGALNDFWRDASDEFLDNWLGVCLVAGQ